MKAPIIHKEYGVILTDFDANREQKLTALIVEK
jgi:hypothetical protein